MHHLKKRGLGRQPFSSARFLSVSQKILATSYQELAQTFTHVLEVTIQVRLWYPKSLQNCTLKRSAIGFDLVHMLQGC